METLLTLAIYIVLYVKLFFAAIPALIKLAVSGATLVAYWKIFSRADAGGWRCLVPGYNVYTFYEVVWGSGWLAAVPLVLMGLVYFLIFSGIPGLLMSLVMLAGYLAFHVITMHKFSACFGYGLGYTLGLIFLHPVFLLLIAFGENEYEGPM